ncbi:unnamed protein product [Ceutorhynchus assimilis]|uniref:Uncharacterized protein n=1 Tax=Ceutorhynchus assimilis TaxID=467358 RepID=A0A9N9QFN9_9CUCU|nr:unnamed protein product [Ceutorhynchus assimilis]
MFLVLVFVCSVHGYPASWVQKIGENAPFNENNNINDDLLELDNYLSKNDSLFADSKTQDYTKMIIPFTADFSDNNKPDGSIDLEAILGLLGSLSTVSNEQFKDYLIILFSLKQNPYGTYDFSGLSDLLRSFFGGDAGGGGSDIGAFAGGLLGAVIKGVANPPGAKGAGILAGKVVTGILPALSGPPPSMEEKGNGTTKAPPLDSGAFLTGFIKTVLGSGGNGMGQGNKNSKYTLFKLLFSAITGVFSAASSLSSSGKSDWN